MPTVASLLQKIADIQTLRVALDAKIAAGLPNTVDLTPVDSALTQLGTDIQNTLNSVSGVSAKK